MTEEAPAVTDTPNPKAEPAAGTTASESKPTSKKSVAIGAAVGIGSAAIVAALLYTRRR